ncbi:hypothetical protein QBC45DRAFT_465513 [Copromyces sp. CBS 386.78]|nr:hypothetical protein QBC45DRAFT_465513 [Copromyces sp. CBS 386.78]
MTQHPWINYLYLDETVYNASELNFPHIRARAGVYTPSNESSHAPPPRNRTVRMRPMPSTHIQASENENLRRFNLRPPTPPTSAEIEAFFAAQEERQLRIEEALCAAERRNFEEALFAAQPEIFQELEQPEWRSNVPGTNNTKKLSTEDKKKQKKKKSTTRGTTKRLAFKTRKVKFVWPNKDVQSVSARTVWPRQGAEKSEEAGDSKKCKKHDSETAEEKVERGKRKEEKKERWQRPQGGHYHLRLLEEIAAPKKVKADASLPAESAPDPNETEEQRKRSL